ncbi:hypothetical protein THAOC_08127 [Thalassiosira oceanica]|uniref:Uncharacterized protein n=1 Tax=Thalassiosira oceanica TaxID=159749 RepID=K0TAP0_THAOC|nr:hypothetical protein THAOC_08127 [Thalassiosira oceanica]|eukprot:EJK70506.1 hypothetical protein THAOC_08127 [Thalassiosira oceanica]
MSEDWGKKWLAVSDRCGVVWCGVLNVVSNELSLCSTTCPTSTPTSDPISASAGLLSSSAAPQRHLCALVGLPFEFGFADQTTPPLSGC